MLLLIPAVCAQCELMEDFAVPDRGGDKKCLTPALRGVNLQGEELQRSLTFNCAWCRDNCLLDSGCNVWVYCDNVDGCDDGNGNILPKDTCIIKKSADEHALIVNIAKAPAALEKPAGALASFDDWVSGTCNVSCDCCGWCGDAVGCDRNCYYCEESRTCTEGVILPFQIGKCLSANCNSDTDLQRIDCVTKATCDNKPHRICPGRVFSGVNKVQAQDLANEYPSSC